MSHRRPRVSVGIPVYNGERFLRETLDSVLSQTYTDFELIISDNGSIDGTAAICHEYAACDERVRYVRSEVNKGAAWNFNNVFGLSSGKYFKWAAYDDICAQDFLLKCVEALDQDESIVLSYPRTVHIDARGDFIKRHQDGLNVNSTSVHERFRNLICVNHWCLSVFGVMRAEILTKTPLIGNYVASDRVLLAELGLWGRFFEVPEDLFLHREHPARSTRALSKLQDRLAWYDPNKATSIVFPQWRLFGEYLSAIQRVPLARVDRLRCRLQLIRWLRRHGRTMGKELVLGADQLLRRLPVLRGGPAFFR